MSIIRLLAAPLLATAVLFALPTGVRAAESLDTCAGFIDSVPTTISTQGVWCLRHDLATAISSGAAITVAANNVTIDCNGFKLGGLAGGNSSLAGGIAATNRLNTTVRNCSIRGFHDGVRFLGASTSGVLIEDNRFDNSLYVGVNLGGSGNVIRRNLIYDTGSPAFGSNAYGIAAHADILDNTVSGVFTTVTSVFSVGIESYGDGDVIRGNRVSGLALVAGGTAFGIRVFGNQNRIADNHITSSAVVSGIGIDASTTSFCRNNTIANFSMAIDACRSSGNDSY